MGGRERFLEKYEAISEIRASLAADADAIVNAIFDLQAEYRAKIAERGITCAESIELYAALDAMMRFSDYDPKAKDCMLADYSPDCFRAMTDSIRAYSDRVGNQYLPKRIDTMRKKARATIHKGYHRATRVIREI